jgi:type 1 glutamine amidotransferase
MLRGPGENMHVLATAFASPEHGGTGRHEPMIFTINYGKGRVFHTPMGHGDYSMECVGFIATLQRGAEWAATGKVTQELPKDFPTAEEGKSRKFGK